MSSSSLSLLQPGPEGFSLEGTSRRGPSVGRDMKMSKSGTPFRGQYPVGWGGHLGTYPSSILVEDAVQVKNPGSTLPAVESILNAGMALTDLRGNNHRYVRPSVLSTRGHLAERYKYVSSGQYPCYWVQPIYTGNQTQTASQGLYLQTKTSSTVRSLDVNDAARYVGDCKKSTWCVSSVARRTFEDVARNAPYSKTLGQPVTSYSIYQQFLTRKCLHPRGAQKPFPFAVPTGTGILSGGVGTVGNVGNACNTSKIYLSPPDWYLADNGAAGGGGDC